LRRRRYPLGRRRIERRLRQRAPLFLLWREPRQRLTLDDKGACWEHREISNAWAKYKKYIGAILENINCPAVYIKNGNY
jgi:hypothetical protein